MSDIICDCHSVKVDLPKYNEGKAYTNAIDFTTDGVIHRVIWIPSDEPLFSESCVEKYELVKIDQPENKV